MLRVFVESLSTRLCAPRIQPKVRAPRLGAATRGVRGDCDAHLLPKCTKTSKELIPQKWSNALEKRDVDVADLQRWKSLEGSATCFKSTTSSIIATSVLSDRLKSNSTGFPKFTESRSNFASTSYDSVRFRPNLVARQFSTGFLNSASACGGGGGGGLGKWSWSAVPIAIAIAIAFSVEIAVAIALAIAVPVTVLAVPVALVYNILHEEFTKSHSQREQQRRRRQELESRVEKHNRHFWAKQ